MPLGKPSPQTRANEKWQKKAGYAVKSFKIKKDVTNQFEAACEKSGRSQSSVITELMERYISETEETG